MLDPKILIVFALAMAALAIGAAYYLYRGMRMRAADASEYALFKRLVRDLDATTEFANSVGRRLFQCNNQVILTSFEANLRALENILESATKLRPYPANRYAIRSLTLLTRECRRRLGRDARDALGKGRRKDSRAEPHAFPTGCYFCSRPFDIVTFKIVRIKQGELTKRPYACSTCRKQLQSKKKVKVLHFLVEGKTLHWSETPGYEAKEHFFTLNNPFESQKKPVLALVYSKKDANNDHLKN